MKKFLLKSLGCKQNALEGQLIEAELSENGYVAADDIKDADFFILNSCTVTSHSDSQANYLLSRAKKINPKIKNVLTGCCAQTGNYNPEIVDVVIGNSDKNNILDYLAKTGVFVRDIQKQKTFQNKFLKKRYTTRMNIKIQDGCNNSCTYCIIPKARGLSRSNTIENIIEQINIAISLDVKEIILTGTHIGQWGAEWGKSLLDLLKEIEKTKIHRYRLGSLYISEITDEMIEFLKKSEKFCPHFHLSLQSLCDKTLASMSRNYTAQDALSLIEKLHKNFHLPFLGCDIIAGFPGEDEYDFNITLKNLESAKLSYIHSFPYSRRKGTKAFSMPQVKDAVKTARAKALQELCQKLHDDFLAGNKAEKYRDTEILIQKRSPKTGLYSALTRNYIKIFFKEIDKLKDLTNKDDLRGTLTTVCLSEFELF